VEFGAKLSASVVDGAVFLDRLDWDPYNESGDLVAQVEAYKQRFNWSGEVWRVAFAFDPKRQAVLLAGGDKAGTNQKRFYQWLIRIADERYRTYLKELATARQEKRGGKHGKRS
jgi:hypothetical protein